MSKIIDLRSDTVTRPSEQMRLAMSRAEVGDDVFREDPTVTRLEELAAGILGKEAALFVTSGTQGNFVSLLTHCNRADGVIAGQSSHIIHSEGGGMAALGGMFPMPVDDSTGLPEINSLEAMLDPERETNVHLVCPKLVCFENTHNARGGHASTPDEIASRVTWAHSKNLRVHIDGARLFNAAVALNVTPEALVKDADSVQICLSKGLGAPMGSLICASKDFIERARFWRKKVGGGLRQVGVVAAAGLYALENNISRLAEDHENAKVIANILHDCSKLEVMNVTRPTNMIYFSLAHKSNHEDNANAARVQKLLEMCRAEGVLFTNTTPALFRLVTHLDINSNDAVRAAEIIARAANAL